MERADSRFAHVSKGVTLMGASSSQAQGFAATPGMADISDAVSSIIKSGEVLVPAMQSAGIQLNQNLASSTSVLKGYGDATAGAINMQQQLLGLKPTDFKGIELQDKFNQLQQGMVSSGLGGDPQLMNKVYGIGRDLSTAYGSGSAEDRQAAFNKAMSGMNDINSGMQNGVYGAPNNGYDISGAYTGGSNVNLGFLGNYNTGKNSGQANPNANTGPDDFKLIKTGNQGGNFSSASGFTGTMGGK